MTDALTPMTTNPTETASVKTMYPLGLATVIRVVSRSPVSSPEKLGRIEMPAAVNQLSTASLTQVGTGTVRT